MDVPHFVYLLIWRWTDELLPPVDYCAQAEVNTVYEPLNPCFQVFVYTQRKTLLDHMVTLYWGSITLFSKRRYFSVFGRRDLFRPPWQIYEMGDGLDQTSLASPLFWIQSLKLETHLWPTAWTYPPTLCGHNKRGQLRKAQNKKPF